MDEANALRHTSLMVSSVIEELEFSIYIAFLSLIRSEIIESQKLL